MKQRPYFDIFLQRAATLFQPLMRNCRYRHFAIGKLGVIIIWGPAPRHRVKSKRQAARYIDPDPPFVGIPYGETEQ